MSRGRKILWGLVGLVVLLGAAYAYLLRSTVDLPSECGWKLDLAKVRAAASSLPGDKPTQIRVEHVTTIQMPRAIIATGGPWAMSNMAVYSYQLVFPGQTLIVDSTMSKAQAEHVSMYDEAAFARVAQGMKQAAGIYVTHEHTDHLGGVVALEDSPEVLAHAHPNSTQLANKEALKPAAFSAEALKKLVPVDAADVKAVAPGVVLIKAPGHTAGSQMVYVQRADGTEYIFTGDTAWHWESIERVREPPHLASVLIKSDLTAQVCQLNALHQLATSDPKLQIVPGHDQTRVEGLIAQGLLTAHFQ